MYVNTRIAARNGKSSKMKAEEIENMELCDKSTKGNRKGEKKRKYRCIDNVINCEIGSNRKIDREKWDKIAE